MVPNGTVLFGLFGSVGPYMVQNDPVWTLSVLYGPARPPLPWPHMVPQGPVWSRRVPQGPAPSHLVLYDLVQPCLALYGSLLPCMALYGVWPCRPCFFCQGNMWCPMVPFKFSWSCRFLVRNVQWRTSWSGIDPNGPMWSSMGHYSLVWLFMVKYVPMQDLENQSYESNQHIHLKSNAYACLCSTHTTFAQIL